MIVPSAELAENQFDPFDYAVVAPIVGEMVERRRSAADLLELFDRRALNPEKFPPDGDGRTLYDRYTRATFKAVLDDAAGRIRRSVYSACRVRRLWSCRSGRLGSTFGKRSSTAGQADTSSYLAMTTPTARQTMTLCHNVTERE